jgi:hypothetical protein
MTEPHISMAHPPTWVLLGRRCPSGLPQVDCNTEEESLSPPLDVGKIQNAAVWLFLPASRIIQCEISNIYFVILVSCGFLLFETFWSYMNRLLPLDMLCNVPLEA